MKILIIGGGNMGKTYADSFLANHAIQKDDLYILEHFEEKVNYFKSIGFKNVFYQPDEYIKAMDLIILAIKPQDTQALFPKIRSYIQEGQTVLSIMAGVRIETLKKELPTKKIVRAMPNLPAQIGMGMTGFTSAEEVSKEEVFNIQNLLNTTGKSLYFDDESKLDAVTAISGSGPAYVFYFMDAMIETAMQMGFTKVQAELLVEQTFMGAVHLLNIHNISCKEWIARVASKGGTTEAALVQFANLKLGNAIQEGLKAAKQRATELGK
ncbi:MAG: pyrroline-5-carboxylate reductase [Thermoflexibacter sp.]